jgi:hypothetical protein
LGPLEQTRLGDALGVHRADGDAKVDWVPRAAMGPMEGQRPECSRQSATRLTAFMTPTSQAQAQVTGSSAFAAGQVKRQVKPEGT